jgi:hypothetical protein
MGRETWGNPTFLMRAYNGEVFLTVVKASGDFWLPHTGQITCDRYPTRDRLGALDRSVTCDRFFEEAGNALS